MLTILEMSSHLESDLFNFQNKSYLLENKTKICREIEKILREFSCTRTQYFQLWISYIGTVQILANESILKYLH